MRSSLEGLLLESRYRTDFLKSLVLIGSAAARNVAGRARNSHRSSFDNKT